MSSSASAVEHLSHVVGDAARVAVDGGEVRVANAEQDVELATAGEERANGDQLGEHDADDEEIASTVQLAAHDLLGRHVPQLALQLTRARAPFELGGAGNAEVRELHCTGAIDEHVSGGDVAVDEAKGLPHLVARTVRVLQASQNGERNVQRDLEGDVLAARGRGADQAGAGGPVHQLHGHVELALFLTEIEHLHDVRVAESGAYARLVDEHGHELGVAGELGQDAFDRKHLLKTVGAGTTS